MGILLTDAKCFGNPTQSDKPLPEQYFFGGNCRQKQVSGWYLPPENATDINFLKVNF